MIYYRVRPSFRRDFQPYDGKAYRYVGPDAVPEYVLVDIGRSEFGEPRPLRIPLCNFERVELEEQAGSSG